MKKNYISVIYQDVATGKMHKIEADRAVLSVSSAVYRDILFKPDFSPSRQESINSAYGSEVVRIFLQFKKRFWEDLGLNGSITTDLPMTRVFPISAQNSPRGLLFCYIYGSRANFYKNMSNEARIQSMLSQIQEIFPSQNIQKLFEKGSSIMWNTEKYMNGANIKWEKGLHTKHSAALSEAEGRLHFAGEHTSIYCGWIEGAVRSAHRVAKEIQDSAIQDSATLSSKL